VDGGLLAASDETCGQGRSRFRQTKEAEGPREKTGGIPAEEAGGRATSNRQLTLKKKEEE